MADLVLKAEKQSQYDPDPVRYLFDSKLFDNFYPEHSRPAVLVARVDIHKSCSLHLTKRTLELAQLKETFKSYSDLEENWDEEGSITPHPTSIESVLQFLDNIPDDVPLPYPEAGRDGDVGIYWDNRVANTFAQVVFTGDGHFTYLAIIKSEDGSEKIYGDEDLPVNQSWPANLIRVIQIAK